MSFDIARTPTLEIVATQDEVLLTQGLQARTQEAITRAESDAEVREAAAAHSVAQSRLEALKKAERELNRVVAGARAHIETAGQGVTDALIESAASGAGPDFGDVSSLALAELQCRYAGRAIERIIEHLIPVAEITVLREESHALIVRARALERIAQERAEKVLGRLREAASEEVVLPVDLSKGVAGALLAQARDFKQHAIKLSETADQLERAYADRHRAATSSAHRSEI